MYILSDCYVAANPTHTVYSYKLFINSFSLYLSLSFLVTHSIYLSIYIYPLSPALSVTLCLLISLFLCVLHHISALISLSLSFCSRLSLSLLLSHTLNLLNYLVGGGSGADVAEEGGEFSLDSMEGGRMRRKSKRQVLIAKDVDIEKVSHRWSCPVLSCPVLTCPVLS